MKVLLTLVLAFSLQAKTLVIWCPTDKPGFMTKCQVSKKPLGKKVEKMAVAMLAAAGLSVLAYHWESGSNKKSPWKAIGPAWPVGGPQR